MNIIRAEYSALTIEMESLINQAKGENRELTRNELKKILKLEEQREALETKIVGEISGNSTGHRAPALEARGNLADYMARAIQAMHKQGISHAADLRELDTRSILSTNSPGTISEAISEFYAPELVTPFELSQVGMMLSFDDNHTKYPYQIGTLDPALTGEASAISAAALTIGAHQVALQKFAIIQKCSLEVFEDAPMTAGMIAQSASHGFSNALSRHVFDEIFANTSTNTIDCTAIAASAFGYNNILQGVRTLEAQGVNHRRAAFVSSPKISENLAKLQATDGQYIIPPAKLNDVRMLTTKAIRETYSTNTATKAILGDFSQARLVVKGIGASVVPSNTLFTQQPNVPTFTPSMMPVNNLYIGTGEMAWLFYLRADVILHRPEAFVVFDNLKF
jgi:HK97 family phage major capsid protein